MDNQAELLGATLQYRAAPQPSVCTPEELVEQARAARLPKAEQPLTELIGDALGAFYARALADPLPPQLRTLADTLETSIRDATTRAVPDTTSATQKGRATGRTAGLIAADTRDSGNRGTAYKPLTPPEVRAAVQAFEAALACVNESATHINEQSARQNLALVIIETALAGERDTVALRDEGLRVLGLGREVAADVRPRAGPRA